MPRPQLESIADEITLSLQVTNEGFFSIKNQILLTFGVIRFHFNFKLVRAHHLTGKSDMR